MARRRSRGSFPGGFTAWLAHRTGWGRSGVQLLAIGLVVLSLWLLASFVGQVIISAQMDRRENELRTEIAQIEAENGRLGTAVVFAESPAYAEHVSREQLGYAREGDVVVVLVAPQPTAPPANPTPDALPLPSSTPNWRGWVHTFFASDAP